MKENFFEFFFLKKVEMFLKDSMDYIMVQYHFRKFEKVEMMALISMEKKQIDKKEFDKLLITYSQALVFLSVFDSINFILLFTFCYRKSLICSLMPEYIIAK